MIDVIVSPQAEAQIQAIDEWWRTHRSAATQLFAQELAAAFEAAARTSSACVERHPIAGGNNS